MKFNAVDLIMQNVNLEARIRVLELALEALRLKNPELLPLDQMNAIKSDSMNFVKNKYKEIETKIK